MKKVWTEVGTLKKKTRTFKFMRGFDNKEFKLFFLNPKLVIVFKAYYVHKYRIMNTCICKNISVNMTLCIKF